MEKIAYYAKIECLKNFLLYVIIGVHALSRPYI